MTQSTTLTMLDLAGRPMETVRALRSATPGLLIHRVAVFDGESPAFRWRVSAQCGVAVVGHGREPSSYWDAAAVARDLAAIKVDWTGSLADLRAAMTEDVQVAIGDVLRRHRLPAPDRGLSPNFLAATGGP